MPHRDSEKARAYDRERYRQLTAERLARGMCPKCGKATPVPDRRLCVGCGENRRKAERDRYAKGKAEGRLYGGRDVEDRRRIARTATGRRYRARLAAELCPRCGKRPPVEGRTACEPYRDARHAGERERWAGRRTAGLCSTCGKPASGDASQCSRCAALEGDRQPSKNATSRRRYARLRARGLCTDCGEPSQGAARCPPCARRSWARLAEHRGLPIWPPRYTVIEIMTGEDHGTWDSLAEVAACLAFARLSADQVEIISDISPMAAFTAW